jgi:hypothetical protein
MGGPAVCKANAFWERVEWTLSVTEAAGLTLFQFADRGNRVAGDLLPHNSSLNRRSLSQLE